MTGVCWKYKIKISIFHEQNKLLDTGGGILNATKSFKEPFAVVNPDTLWNKDYIDEINKMQNFYFSNKLTNLLLAANKRLSFDKNLKGDFELTKNLLMRSENNDFVYIGCQILNKKLFEKYKIQNFSISEIWNELLKNNKLNGYESNNKFYHLTNLETFKKLKDF